jgi:hypothetical protein
VIFALKPFVVVVCLTSKQPAHIFSFSFIYSCFNHNHLTMSKSGGKVNASRAAGTPGVKATKAYRTGDIVISSKHFVHVVAQEFKGQYCDNCFKEL